MHHSGFVPWLVLSSGPLTPRLWGQGHASRPYNRRTYWARDPDILQLYLKICHGILTLPHQKSVCAGILYFEVLQFETGGDVACFLATLIAGSGRLVTSQV